MPGGPLFFYSAYPSTSGTSFPHFFTNNGRAEEGLGVSASLGTDAVWLLFFELPPSLPTGVAKLRLRSRANAATGAAKVNVKWGQANIGEDPGNVVLTAEGASTITWTTGDENKYKETKIVLDANTVTANRMIVMELVFETSGWTLAQLSSHMASIIWE